MAKNKEVQRQMEKIRKSKNTKANKVTNNISSMLGIATGICIVAFIVLLCLKIGNVISVGWFVPFIPIIVLVGIFIISLIIVGKTLISAGMIDPNKIKQEEMRKRKSQTQKYQDIVEAKKKQSMQNRNRMNNRKRR